MATRTDFCETCARPIATHQEREWRRYQPRTRERFCGQVCRVLAPGRRDDGRSTVVHYLRYVMGLNTLRIAELYGTSKQNVAYILRRR